jgi:hypothetical protein
MKNYVVFVNDHSGSMSSLARQALQDYNGVVHSIKEAAIAENQDTIVSVVECGGGVRVPVRNSSITALAAMTRYATSGGTPLFRSIDTAIEICETVPDFNDPDVSFLIYITTDGEETENRSYGRTLGQKIRRLQASDRWTFAFRVPRGYARDIVGLGIPEGNVIEWDQTTRGLQVAQTQSQEAFRSYFTARTTGARSVSTFYANLADVSSADVKAALEDVSTKVLLWPVAESEHGIQIRDFVETRLNGKPLKRGAAFYQLTKSEDEVQATKRICIRDKTNNAIYYGDAARQLLGLPQNVTVRLKPDDLSNFDVFIQSTSVNRKVQKGSQILYWDEVGVGYKEGPSARQ